MTISIALSLIVALVGLVLYFLPMANAKLTEAGRLMFALGLLATLLHIAGRATLSLN